MLVGRGLKVWLLFVLCMGVSAAQDLPRVSPGWTENPPVLDGVLDSSEWSSAREVTLGQYETGEILKENTSALLMYDREYLYIGFQCHESDMANVVAKCTAENSAVFMDDCVEVMLSGEEAPQSESYIHLVSNSNGVKYTSNTRYPERLPIWNVKTNRQSESWTVEIRIKLSTIVDPNTNAAFWRINLFRERWIGGQGQFSSWAKTPLGFHTPYSFGILEGIDLDGKFIGLKKSLSQLETSEQGRRAIPLPAAYDPYISPLVVIPKPVKLVPQSSPFELGSRTVIVIPDNASERIRSAADEINEELNEEYGLDSIAIITYSLYTPKNYTNSIVLGQADKFPALKSALNELGQSVDSSSPGPEGYVLTVRPRQILIGGSDEDGTYYGVQSLKQLMRAKADKSVMVLGADIWDKPAFKIRAAHVHIDNESPLAHAWMIRKIFSRYKFNTLIFESSHGMAWKSHTELLCNYSVSPEHIKELVKLAKQRHIAVYPLVQSLGHGEWMFRNNSTNIDFCEDSSAPWAYCPMDTKSYDFIFDLYKEAIDIYDNPKYFHIGHDEIDNPGKFPNHETCKSVGIEKLYFSDTLYVYNFLKARGITPVMWGDIFLRDNHRPYVDALPKDMVIADWHYDPALTQPSVDFYRDKGLQIWGSTFYHPANIARFSEQAYKKGSEGMLHTTWAGYYGSASLLEREPHQMASYIVAGDWFWNPVNRDWKNPEYNADNILRRLYYGNLFKKRKQSGFAVDLSPYANIKLQDNGQLGFMNAGVGNDLSCLVNSTQKGDLHAINDVHYRLSEKGNEPVGIFLRGSGITLDCPIIIENIQVNKKTDTLEFLHGTLLNAPPQTLVGRYHVNFEDGISLEIPLYYGTNISGWQDLQGYFNGQLAFQGCTSTGQPVYLRQMSWKNPRPDREIVSIDFICDYLLASPFLIAVTGTDPLY